MSISVDVQNQLLNLQQQVANVMNMQQQNQLNVVNNQVLQMFAPENQAEVEALRNIADTAVQHAQATSVQAQLAVAAVQQQAAEAVRSSEQATLLSAQQAVQTYEAQLQQDAAAHVNQRMMQLEQEMTQRFEQRMHEMRLAYEKEVESAQNQSRAAKELAEQQVIALQQELHSVKTQQKLNGPAPANTSSPSRLNLGTPPGLNPTTPIRVDSPANVRIHSPDKLHDWYRDECPQPRVSRNLLSELEIAEQLSQRSQNFNMRPASRPPVPVFPQPNPEVQELKGQVVALGNLLQQLINVQLQNTSAGGSCSKTRK